MRKNSFDIFFKLALLLFAVYFLFILTKIANSMDKASEIGRYQFNPKEWQVIDTKTGIISRPSTH